MDIKCVRVLRPYEESTERGMLMYIDDEARYALNKQWGETAVALGRRKVSVKLAPLKPLDKDGYIARAHQEVIDALYIEYGEEVLLSSD